MTDLKELFELALAGDADGDAPAGAADPAADLARGRKLLARRTRRRMLGGVAVTAAGVAAAAVVILPGGAGAGPGPTRAGAAVGSRTAVGSRAAVGSPAAVGSRAAAKPTTATVRLVAYTGAQPPGYTVRVIPAGWVIQGSNPFALVIAPANAPNKDPDAFIGKLVVGQESFDPAGSSGQGWAPVPVAGHTAYYSVQDAGGTETAGLVLKKTASDWLTIQAPTSLGWSRQQMIQFALGVTILGTAQEGKG
jgi:hypothetical protein